MTVAFGAYAIPAVKEKFISLRDTQYGATGQIFRCDVDSLWLSLRWGGAPDHEWEARADLR